MSKLFIIEGPDCSGKSTLSKYLARELNAVRWHMTWTPGLTEGMFDYQLNALQNAEWLIKGQNMPVIFDRLWPSELVYGSIFRPERMPHFNHMALREIIDRLGGVYIFCQRPDVVSAHEAQKDQAHPYDRESFIRVVNGYSRLVEEMLKWDKQGDRVLIYRYDIFAHQLPSFKMMIQNL